MSGGDVIQRGLAEERLPVRERLLGDPDLLDLIFGYLDPRSITSVATVSK